MEQTEGRGGAGETGESAGKEEEVGKNALEPSALREGLATSLAFHFPAFPCQPPPKVRAQDRAKLRAWSLSTSSCSTVKTLSKEACLPQNSLLLPGLSPD